MPQAALRWVHTAAALHRSLSLSAPLTLVPSLYHSPQFLVDSIVADVIDYDEFLTGYRSEGRFTVFQVTAVCQVPAPDAHPDRPPSCCCRPSSRRLLVSLPKQSLSHCWLPSGSRSLSMASHRSSLRLSGDSSWYAHTRTCSMAPAPGVVTHPIHAFTAPPFAGCVLCATLPPGSRQLLPKDKVGGAPFPSHARTPHTCRCRSCW